MVFEPANMHSSDRTRAPRLRMMGTIAEALMMDGCGVEMQTRRGTRPRYMKVNRKKLHACAVGSAVETLLCVFRDKVYTASINTTLHRLTSVGLQSDITLARDQGEFPVGCRFPAQRRPEMIRFHPGSQRFTRPRREYWQIESESNPPLRWQVCQ